MQLLFADQLGQHFDLSSGSILPIALKQFAKRRYHRKKAHLILSAVLRRAASANCEAVYVDTYRDLTGVATIAVNPTSYPMRRLTESLGLEVVPARGFICSESDWQKWVSARQNQRFRLEDFYRWQRQRTGILMEGTKPAGGRWNLDSENRLGAKQIKFDIAEPWLPKEDIFDEEARDTLNRLVRDGVAQFSGSDGPREFAASREEAASALEYFVSKRLATFGPPEDAMLRTSWTVSHSLLSVPMNLGLIDPMQVVKSAELAYLSGTVPLQSAEGFVRQIMGWRDYVWHLYWHFGEQYPTTNFLNGTQPIPDSWVNLDAAQIEANCISQCISDLKQHGWLHHIQRLMVLGNVALQRGLSPQAVNDWFVDNFVDGTPWVMPANVVGMTLYANGGQMSTKPYVAGGAYINRMSDYCGGCKFQPNERLGDTACPMTGGYWAFLQANQGKLSNNPRIAQQLRGLSRLGNAEQISIAEARRSNL